MTEQRQRKIDAAWAKVVRETALLQEIRQQGHFLISAQDIRRITGEEARLMVKFDTAEDRPHVFKQHHLNILPLNRGQYVIFRDRDNVAFAKLLPRNYRAVTPTPHVPVFNLARLETLRTQGCTTESEAIELAILSGLLDDFVGTRNLRQTRRGRFGSRTFEIKLPDYDTRLQVRSSQIEVDSTCESDELVVLIEAKIGFHKDFNIRQLYYPYLYLAEQTRKPIRSIVLCYSNDQFQLTEFRIGSEFGDIEIIRQEVFILDEYVLGRGDPQALSRGSAQEDFSVPFPQADDADKVIDIVRLVRSGITEPQRLAQILGFDERQSYYYLDAARYLQLLKQDGTISAVGVQTLNIRERQNRTEAIMKRMLDRPALRDAIMLLQERNFAVESISSIELRDLIAAWRPDEYAEATLLRRAQTVKNWLRWLVANCDFQRRR